MTFVTQPKGRPWRSAWRRLMAAVMACAAATAPALAAPYPDHDIKIIVPFAPGGGNDALGRVVAKLLSESLKVPVVVENKEGAGGKIGVEAAVKSRPDGYTLLLVSNSYAVNAALYKLPFDSVRDITPIGMIARGPLLLVTASETPVSVLQQLIALAKAKDGTLTYASSGVGGISHLATELFLKDANVRMSHVPYRGTSPALLDTLAGRTVLFFSTSGAALPYIKNGRLKVLAQTLPTSWSEMPSVPTVAQAGLPNYQVALWYGVIAPKGLPAEVRQRLNTALNAAIAQPEVERQIKSEGNQASTGTPDQFLKQISTEIGAWQKVVAEAHIKVD
jgi:tripartite-type tricarboxylate transporter receptor subunit TctC